MLVCPAYAVDSSAPDLANELLTDEELYELEYEQLLISGMDDEAALFSLNDDDPDRLWTLSYGILRWSCRDIDSVDFNYGPDLLNFEWEGPGSYRLGSYTFTDGQNFGSIRMKVGSYYDITAPVSYRYSDGSKLVFEGTLRYSTVVTWFNQTAFVDGNVMEYSGVAAYPERVALLVNGDVVASFNASDTLGNFQIEYEHEMTETVNSIGYRFYYDSQVRVSGSYPNTSGSFTTGGLYFYFDDSAFVTSVESDVYLPLFQEVITEVKQIPSTIYNFFFGESGGDDAAGFKSEVDSAVSSVDQVQQEIAEGLDKPEPDEIVPDITDIVPEDDYATYTDIFAPVVQSSLFSSMMMVVVSMAFISYVLFGKKG